MLHNTNLQANIQRAGKNRVLMAIGFLALLVLLLLEMTNHFGHREALLSRHAKALLERHVLQIESSLLTLHQTIPLWCNTLSHTGSTNAMTAPPGVALLPRGTSSPSTSSLPVDALRSAWNHQHSATIIDSTLYQMGLCDPLDVDADIVVTQYNAAIIFNAIPDHEMPSIHARLINRETGQVLLMERDSTLQQDTDAGDPGDMTTSTPDKAPHYQASISGTPMAIQVHISDAYSEQQWLNHFKAPLGLVLVFISVMFVFWRRIKNIETTALNSDLARSDIETRSSLVLNAISDCLICTDCDGHIVTVNRNARDLLTANSSFRREGDTLSDLWLDDNALWNQDVQPDKPTPQYASHYLSATLNNGTILLEQQYQPTFRDGAYSGGVWLLRDITESLATRRASERNRRRYETLFAAAGVGHCVIDASCFLGDLDSLVLTTINQEILNITGASSEAQLHNHYHQLFVDDGESLIHMISRCLSQPDHSDRDAEMTISRFDGTQRDVSVHFGNAGYANILVSMIDITENKRATRRIQEQEAYWRAVMASMPVIVHIARIDDDGHPLVQYRNRSASEYLGYSKRSPDTDQDWLQYGNDVFRRETHSILHQLKTMPPGQTVGNTGTFFRRDGEQRFMQFEYTPLGFDNATGTVTSYIGIARDVTSDAAHKQQMIESNNRYRLLADNMTDIVWATNTHLTFTFVSPSVQTVLGYTPDEIKQGKGGDIFSRHAIAPLLRQLQQHIDLAQKAENDAPTLLLQRDITATAKNGQRYELDLHVSPIRDKQGNLQGLLGVCRNVTDTRQNERELKQAATVFGNSNEAILITDHHLRIIKANESFYSLTGLSPHDVLMKTPISFLAEGNLDHIRFQDISDTLRSEGYWQGEINYRCANDRIRNGWVGVSLIREQRERDQTFTIIMSDLTERRVIEEDIHRLAYYDALTGLPNRSQLRERLDIMVKQAHIAGGSGALLFIDLDRFKPINDSFGHPAGDQVLRDVAQRLRRCVKAKDLVCRMGGDEFTAALNFSGDPGIAPVNAQRVAHRILRQLSLPYQLDQRAVHISASIGIALYPSDGNSETELLKNADMAMYHAKSAGRNNVQFFDDKMRQKAIYMLELENDLHQAMSNQQLSLSYQPQFQSTTRQAHSVEALIRWHHPTRGHVDPGIFVSILEETGLIIPVGRWVLHKACHQLAIWQQQGIGFKQIAVNVSSAQFADPDFVRDVRETIIDAGILPSQLELELTESLLMKDDNYGMTTLKELRELGVRIAIDDFGTGYSSLKYLSQLPVDMLKIDQAFIQKLPTKDSVALVRTIITLAKNMDLEVIAEGVENCEQLNFLTDEGCHKVQGYLMSKPLTSDGILASRGEFTFCCKREESYPAFQTMAPEHSASSVPPETTA